MARRPGRAVGAVACLVLLLAAAGAHAETVRVGDRGFAAAAARVPMGGALRVEGVALGPAFEQFTLALTRFEVFAPGAELVVHDGAAARRLPLPANRYFRGAVEGLPGSRAYVSVRESGAVVGIVTTDDGLHQLDLPARGERRPRPAVRQVSAEEAAPFECGTEGVAPPEEDDLLLFDTRAPVNTVNWTARIAVETDYEFYTRLGGTTAATNYVADLFGYASLAYANEVATELQVSYLRLWSSSSDPWKATTSSAALSEFVSYWNQKMGSVSRSLAHFVSSRSTGGGVAYLSALCSTSTGYGFSGNIRGTFQPGNPVPGWDIIVVSHEIGHNFGSPHTHDYCKYGGSNSPVDLCYTSSTCGAQKGLPGVNSLTGGTAGARNGTFMSYCHLLGGGYGNVALRFGESHPYGILAQRVPDRMYAHVQSRAKSYPACLPPAVADLIFKDGLQR